MKTVVLVIMLGIIGLALANVSEYTPTIVGANETADLTAMSHPDVPTLKSPVSSTWSFVSTPITWVHTFIKYVSWDYPYLEGYFTLLRFLLIAATLYAIFAILSWVRGLLPI